MLGCIINEEAMPSKPKKEEIPMESGESSYRRFLDGDESAFDDIVKQLFHSLVFFINGYVHDVYAAEDIAIDVFSELIVHKHGYNFKVSLKTYLFMLGKSRALNFLKRKKVIATTDISELSDITDETTLLEELVLKEERKRIVNTAITNLPQDMREVVHLIYFEDMSYAEAANIMKKNKKQIDNLLYRAKNELRLILGEDGKQLL